MAALICFALELQNIELLNNHFGHLTSLISVVHQRSEKFLMSIYTNISSLIYRSAVFEPCLWYLQLIKPCSYLLNSLKMYIIQNLINEFGVVLWVFCIVFVFWLMYLLNTDTYLKQQMSYKHENVVKSFITSLM